MPPGARCAAGRAWLREEISEEPEDAEEDEI
jgi:hypothetical protein